MFSVNLFIKLLVVCSCVCMAWATPQHFENTKIIRTFDLKSPIAHEESGIRAKNIAAEPVSDYYFYLPGIIYNSTASITASLRKEKTPLTVTEMDKDVTKDINVFKVTLNEPLAPQEDVLLSIKMDYVHSVKPMPKELPQLARQHTIFAFSTFFTTPYHTKETKTVLTTPSKNIITHTGATGHVTLKDNKVTYGPFTDVQPLAFELSTLHYENGKPMLTITELVRDLEVSHWGNNLAVEEHYALRNDGAKLEKEFSRVQYQLTAQVHEQTNVLKSLSFDLPVSAHDPYYRDEVGNVSTSNFRVEAQKSVLEIRPRYPLFGGWNYTWYHGYNADLGSFVHRAKDGKYILNVNFVENVKEMTIDHAIVRAVLPEGATNIKVHTPFAIDSEEITSHFTNFDSTGRVMVTLKKKNVIRGHEAPIQIEYEYPTIRLMQKPVVASVAIFTLFIISIALSKVPFTIGNKKKSVLKTE